MGTITTFPERFKLVNELIAEITFIHALSADDHDAATLAYLAEHGITEDYRYCELWIVLKDGRSFGYMAALPEYLRYAMDKEGLLSFVSLGLLVVSKMTEEAIMHALEECLSEASYHEVEPLGYRMSAYEDESALD
ncbi:MAG: hypothetical protein ABJA50_06435 [Chloroflexota bacterium]